MNDPGWDKRLTKEITDLGLSWDDARKVVGIIAEQRQVADQIGYIRGYNNGYEDAENKFKGTSVQIKAQT